MKGLELARKFYEHCRPILLREIPDIVEQAAFGLAGEGSECFGLDDGFSQDHDFGPGFCLWLPENILEPNRAKIERALELLPKEFAGFPSRMSQRARRDRIGPISVESFYEHFTQLSAPPQTWQEWINISEEKAAAAVNGEVFEDLSGQFSAWRQELLNFYPKDIILKKIAGRAMLMAQAGQYNLPRSLARGDSPAAMLACAKFAESAISLVFLFNRRFAPYYKLAPRLARRLPVLGEELFELLENLAARPLRGKQDMESAELIEEFCAACAARLRGAGLSADPGDWLWAHGPQIAEKIQNRELLKLDLLKP